MHLLIASIQNAIAIISLFMLLFHFINCSVCVHFIFAVNLWAFDFETNLIHSKLLSDRVKQCSFYNVNGESLQCCCLNLWIRFRWIYFVFLSICWYLWNERVDNRPFVKTLSWTDIAVLAIIITFLNRKSIYVASTWNKDLKPNNNQPLTFVLLFAMSKWLFRCKKHILNSKMTTNQRPETEQMIHWRKKTVYRKIFSINIEWWWCIRISNICSFMRIVELIAYLDSNTNQMIAL